MNNENRITFEFSVEEFGELYRILDEKEDWLISEGVKTPLAPEYRATLTKRYELVSDLRAKMQQALDSRSGKPDYRLNPEAEYLASLVCRTLLPASLREP